MTNASDRPDTPAVLLDEASNKLRAALQCHPNAVSTLIEEAIALLAIASAERSPANADALDILDEVLAAKSVMSARGCNQAAPFGEMFSEFVSRFTSPPASVPTAYWWNDIGTDRSAQRAIAFFPPLDIAADALNGLYDHPSEAMEIVRELATLETLRADVEQWAAGSTQELGEMHEEHSRRHTAVWSRVRTLLNPTSTTGRAPVGFSSVNSPAADSTAAAHAPAIERAFSSEVMTRRDEIAMSDRHGETPKLLSVLDLAGCDTIGRHDIRLKLENALSGSSVTGQPAWRVGLFQSSSDPSRQVLLLSQGARIKDDEKHHSFVRWVGADPVAPAGVPPADDLVARCRELEEIATAGRSEQTSLNRLADTYRSDISSHDREEMARTQTHRDAMRFVLASASSHPPAAHSTIDTSGRKR
jgi:hypothetical protein